MSHPYNDQELIDNARKRQYPSAEAIRLADALERVMRERDELETQASVTAWQWATFPAAAGNATGYFLRMFEEVIELGFALGLSGRDLEEKVLEGVRKTVGDTDDEAMEYAYGSTLNPDAPEECADVKIVLYGLARCLSVDLNEEVVKKMKINRARDWTPRNDGSGHADHVKDSEAPGFVHGTRVTPVPGGSLYEVLCSGSGDATTYAANVTCPACLALLPAPGGEG